jgi:hypothetical protein
MKRLFVSMLVVFSCWSALCCEDINTKTPLETFLGPLEPPINEAIKLADKGYRRYQDKSVTMLDSFRKKRSQFDRSGGFEHGFIEIILGQHEKQTVIDLEKIDPPSLFSVDEIDLLYQQLTAKNPRTNDDLAKFFLTKGVGANYLHQSPRAKNSFWQVASQFNWLESTSREEVVKVSEYLYDDSQGSIASREALAAALHRYAAVKDQKLPHSLVDILPNNPYEYFFNGYLELFKIKDQNQMKDLRQQVEKNIGKLRILPQWVKHEASGNMTIQVFSAAPSYQEAHGHKIGKEDEYPLANLLVTKQYEAIAKLAVIRSLLTKTPVNIHFTLLGQGAFKNPAAFMKSAFAAVIDVVTGYPQVQVYIHGYSDNDQKLIAEQIKGLKVNGVPLDRQTFMTQE